MIYKMNFNNLKNDEIEYLVKILNEIHKVYIRFKTTMYIYKI